jgi:hypothetical protein
LKRFVFLYHSLLVSVHIQLGSIQGGGTAGPATAVQLVAAAAGAAVDRGGAARRPSPTAAVEGSGAARLPAPAAAILEL